MKKILLAITALSFAACQPKQAEPEVKTAPALEQTQTEEKPTIELASNEDPICKMSVADGYADTTMYDGKIYGFCSPDCKTEFLKDPASYIASK